MNYGKSDIYVNNCQCCVAVHEARLRGLNITAVGYSGRLGSVTKRLGDNFQDIWVNAKSGETPNVTTLRADTGEALLGKLNKATAAKERYHIGINFDEKNGHIVTAERTAAGKLLVYDPQNDTFLNLEELSTIVSIEVLKVDNMLFDGDMLKSISLVR